MARGERRVVEDLVDAVGHPLRVEDVGIAQCVGRFGVVEVEDRAQIMKQPKQRAVPETRVSSWKCMICCFRNNRAGMA